MVYLRFWQELGRAVLEARHPAGMRQDKILDRVFLSLPRCLIIMLTSVSKLVATACAQPSTCKRSKICGETRERVVSDGARVTWGQTPRRASLVECWICECSCYDAVVMRQIELQGWRWSEYGCVYIRGDDRDVEEDLSRQHGKISSQQTSKLITQFKSIIQRP
jgi:hypothetical protein